MMTIKRKPLIAGCTVLLCFAALAQRRGMRSSRNDTLPAGKTAAEKRILGVLGEALRAGEAYLEAPVSDGRMLRLLTEAVGAKNVVEIGTSTGISGLWFSLALQATGGKLTTFEIDHGRASMARQHFEKAGAGAMVNIVEGDAHQTTKQLKEPIDVLFIDADKEGYLDYLNRLLPLVRPGGLILAHNIDMAQDYDRAVAANPDLETVYYREGAGMSVTLKKR